MFTNFFGANVQAEIQMAVNKFYYTPRKLPASEEKLNLLRLESNFYRTCNAVRENGIELQKLRNHILNEILQNEMEKRQQIHLEASEKIQQLQDEKEERCKEIQHLKDELKGVSPTVEVVRTKSTLAEKDDSKKSPLHLKEPSVSTQTHLHVESCEISSPAIVDSHAYISASTKKDSDSVCIVQVSTKRRTTRNTRKNLVPETIVKDDATRKSTTSTRNRRKTADRKTLTKQHVEGGTIKNTDKEKSSIVTQDVEHQNQQLSSEEHSVSAVHLTKSSSSAVVAKCLDTSSEDSPFTTKRKKRGRPRKRRLIVCTDEERGDDGPVESKGDTEASSMIISDKANVTTVRLGKRSRKDEHVDVEPSMLMSGGELVEDTGVSCKMKRKTLENQTRDAPLLSKDQPSLDTSPDDVSTKERPARKRRRKRIIPKQYLKQTTKSKAKVDSPKGSSNSTAEMAAAGRELKHVATTDCIGIRGSEPTVHTVVPKDKAGSKTILDTQSTSTVAVKEKATKFTREAKLILQKVSQTNVGIGSLHKDTHKVDDPVLSKREVAKRTSRKSTQTKSVPAKSDGDEPVETAKTVRGTRRPRAKTKSKKEVTHEAITKKVKQTQQSTVSVSTDKAPKKLVTRNNKVPPESRIPSNCSLEVGVGLNPLHEPLRSISPEIPLQNTDIVGNISSTTSSQHTDKDEGQQIPTLHQQSNKQPLNTIITKPTNSAQELQAPSLPPPSAAPQHVTNKSKSIDHKTVETEMDSVSLQHVGNNDRSIGKTVIEAATSILTSQSNATITTNNDSAQSVASKRTQDSGTERFANPETKRRRTFLSKRSKNASMFHLSVVEDKEAPRRRTVLSVNTRGISAPKLKNVTSGSYS